MWQFGGGRSMVEGCVYESRVHQSVLGTRFDSALQGLCGLLCQVTLLIRLFLKIKGCLIFFLVLRLIHIIACFSDNLCLFLTSLSRRRVLRGCWTQPAKNSLLSYGLWMLNAFSSLPAPPPSVYLPLF